MAGRGLIVLFFLWSSTVRIGLAATLRGPLSKLHSLSTLDHFSSSVSTRIRCIFSYLRQSFLLFFCFFPYFFTIRQNRLFSITLLETSSSVILSHTNKSRASYDYKTFKMCVFVEHSLLDCVHTVQVLHTRAMLYSIRLYSKSFF